MNKNNGILIVRISSALVFLWFGIGQILTPEKWVSNVPSYALKLIPISVNTFVIGNGIFEAVLGLLLLIGLYTRFASFLLTLHMLHILTIVGYNALGVRDFAIMMSTFAVFVGGADLWTLDSKRANKTT